MKDKYKMEGHKLLWHLDRVNQWKEGKLIAPIHIDVGLSKGCNIKCEYCYGVTQGNLYAGGAKTYFPKEALLRYMRDAGKAGVRSMAFIGEGEPLMNPHLYEAISEGSNAGVDISLGTNGTIFNTGEKGFRALKDLTWLRFNLSAASKEAYKRVHGSPLFDKLLKNIRFCVEQKQKHDLLITIGLQMVLTPSNVDQVVDLSKLGKELGVDYLVVKQCSDTQNNDIGVYKQLDKYIDFSDKLKEAEEVSCDGYNVIVKWNKIQNQGVRHYDQCLAPPFLLYSSGDGRLYPCGMFFDIDEEKYRMGDLTKQSFTDIINSNRYREVIDLVSQIDVHKKCYSNCRSHWINDFLNTVNSPPEHVNFI